MLAVSSYCGWNIMIALPPLGKSDPGRDSRHGGPAPFSPGPCPMVWYTWRSYTCARHIPHVMVHCACVYDSLALQFGCVVGGMWVRAMCVCRVSGKGNQISSTHRWHPPDTAQCGSFPPAPADSSCCGRLYIGLLGPSTEVFHLYAPLRPIHARPV